MPVLHLCTNSRQIKQAKKVIQETECRNASKIIGKIKGYDNQIENTINNGK